MLEFLATHPYLQAPRITLTPRGNFMVSWRQEKDRPLTREVVPDGPVRWLVFAPPRRGESSKRRAAGDGSIQGIMKDIASYRVREWVERAT